MAFAPGGVSGHWAPREGVNDIAHGPISFETLAAYEAYRTRLRADTEAPEGH